MSINIRLMNENDVDDVLEIEKKSFSTPWSKEAFEMEMNNKLANYVVIEVDDNIIGYGGIWLIIDEGHITNVAIDPHYRGKGYSNHLVKGIIDLCLDNNIDRMTLEVRKSNVVAQNLYKKFGFEECGIRPGYYADTKEDAIIMWCNVNK